MTYGSGDEAPRPDGSFEPPLLDAEFLEHFEELLRRFARTATGDAQPIQLLSVLIDFHFCQDAIAADGGWGKQGRADAFRDPIKRSRT